MRLRSLLPHGPLGRGILLVALLWGSAHADSEEEEPDATALVFEASASIKRVTSLGEQDFRFSLDIENPKDAARTIEAADLLLAHEGGWLTPLDPDPMDGTFFRGTLDVPASERIAVGSWNYRSLTPATHALLSVRADDGTRQTGVPIPREGYAAPGPLETFAPLGVGCVGPLEIVSFSDGRRSIMLVGQHQALDGPAPEDVTTRVFVGSDAGATEPEIWQGLEGGADRVALWPFVRRLDVYREFDKGWVLVEVEATIAGKRRKLSRTWPVEAARPIAVASPVLGAWQLGNGPGQTTLSPHAIRPDHRYAYDLVVVEDGRTHHGDPHKNASYFAWDRSIRAVADGVVVDVCDREPDNPGYRGSISDCFNNRIVLKHDDGVYTAYLHIRQRSAGFRTGNRVKAGQVIAKVGNSGNSSEPHLHFEAFRVDKAGRIRPVPVTFTNAFHDARGTQSVEGVVVGGNVVYFRK